MKYLHIFIPIFIIITACTSADEKADDWQTVLSKNGGDITLKYVASDGFAYHDESGELTGVTTEIFRDFVGWVEDEFEVALEVHYRPYESWSNFYNDVRDAPDGTFGMGNVTITEVRRQELDFSPPYMTNIAVLISHQDTRELSALHNIEEEFSHLRALAFEGTLHEERLKQFQDDYFDDMEVDFAHSNNEIIERVAESDRYFAYVDVYNFWRAKEAGALVRQHAVGDEPSEQFGYIIPNNSGWEPVIRQFFEEDGGYVNSERYRQIMETHLGTGLANLLEEARN